MIAQLADRQSILSQRRRCGLGRANAEIARQTSISRNPRFITSAWCFCRKPAAVWQSCRPFHAILGTVDELPSYIRLNNVDDVVICLPWSADNQITRCLDRLRELPVNVYLGADLIGFRLPVRPAPDHFERIAAC